MTEDKPTVVEVIRYIRPHEHYRTCEEYGHKYRMNTNLYGITVAFLLDYEENIVLATWSVCNGENFSRKAGIEAINNREKQFAVAFPLEDVDNDKGLVNALSFRLVEYVYGDPVSHDMKNHLIEYGAPYWDMHELFSKGLRKITQNLSEEVR